MAFAVYRGFFQAPIHGALQRMLEELLRTLGVEWVPGCSGSLVTQTHQQTLAKGEAMNSIVYIIGLVVVIIAILSFFGLR